MLRNPQPVAHLARLGADGLEFSLQYWIDHLANPQPAVRSMVNLGVLRGLRAANIDIPHPQRVVHLKQEAQGPISSATATTG